MENTNYSSACIQKIRVEEIVISEATRKLYEYSNREHEINTLVESIYEIGQQQPIIVLYVDRKPVIIDGVLRYEAIKRLEINEVDAIISDFVPSDQLSLIEFIIHHHLRKEKTLTEKLNEVRSLLRIESDNKNPLRDKDKRVKLISSMLGKGWCRNNVFSLERILQWELNNSDDYQLAQKVLKNEIPIKRAYEAIDLMESNDFDKSKEDESCIVQEFIKGSFDKGKAEKLMTVFDRKKAETYTEIELYPVEAQNFEIIQGNIEDIELPLNLWIDSLFTSPPYYKQIKYGTDPNELGWEKTPEEFVKRLADILIKCLAKLKDTGSMFINMGDSYDNNECLAIPEQLTIELIKRGAKFVQRIIWKKVSNKPNPNQVQRLIPGYEIILHFAKTKNYHFERFRIKKNKTLQVSRCCKEKNLKQGNYHIPNNYLQYRNVIVENEINDILNVQMNSSRTKHIEGEPTHPATFSNLLPLIPLMISCPKNRETIVFDPFMGSGSCGVTALKLGFKFVGVELYENNIVTAHRILTEGQSEYDEVALNNLLKEIDMINDSEMEIAA